MNTKQYRQLMRPSEKSIQSEVIGWLRAHGYYVMRINSGKYAVGEGTSRRFVMGAEAGTPDVLAFQGYQCGVCEGEDYDGDCSTELLFVEVKKPGNHPTFLQEQKMKELEEHGARCIVVHSVVELEEKI